jgi:hypothetical protein
MHACMCLLICGPVGRWVVGRDPPGDNVNVPANCAGYQWRETNVGM